MNKLPNDQLIQVASSLQVSLSSPTFSTLVPSPQDVWPVLNLLIRENALCRERNFSRVAIRDDLRHQLLQLIRQQVQGVNYIAKGDFDILRQSGLQLRKERSAPYYLNRIVMKSIVPGSEDGSLVVKLNKVNHSQYYQIEITEEAGSMKIFTSHNTTVRAYGLKLGAHVTIVARAYSSRGSGEASNGTSYFIPKSHSTLKNRTIMTIHPDESAS
jgi:hypothetical protein